MQVRTGISTQSYGNFGLNAGVSIEAVRRRLGHASTETTQLYTLLAGQVADAEIRAARRRGRSAS